MAHMTCTAVGDMLVQKRLPGAYPGFEELKRFLAQGDARFVNMETTLHYHESYGSAYSGGSWLCADPRVLDDAKEYGFNCMNLATNHSMDFSYGGLTRTLHYAREAGMPVCGTGLCLEEAAAPVYIDTLAGRFALIGAVSTFNPAAMAGHRTYAMEGRPGVNGVRFEERFLITPELMAQVKTLAKETAINGYDDIVRAEGYLPPLPPGCFALGSIVFKEAEENRRTTRVDQTDMKRIERAIFEAKFQADYVIVSMHSHEILHTSKEEPAEFFVEFSRRCIDAGADALVGHGPHLLRPIEIYKGKPIFYSLGDFMLHNENIPAAPAEFFDDYGLSHDATMRELFATRSNNFTRGLQRDRRMLESVAAKWEVEDGVLKSVTLLPLELGFGLPNSVVGWPKPCYDGGIIERLIHMSAPWGTDIRLGADGCGHIDLA